MTVIAAIVLGLLIGWLAEWVIDWFYWRGRIERIADENAALQGRISSLESERDRRPAAFEANPLMNADGSDNLRAVKGIGPVFAARLKEAGVLTFEHLSGLSSQELEEILGPLYKRFFAKEAGIRGQAKEFAARRAAQG